MWNKRLALAALLVARAAGLLEGQALNGPTPAGALTRAPMVVAPVPSAPVIDGLLDDAAWQEAARLEGFVQTEPGDNTAPSRATVVRLGYDARALYIAIEAEDDSADVRATLAARDAILDDDLVTIYLDTFGDHRRAYLLAFNPLGVQQDGILIEGAAAPDYSVDVVMVSRGRITAHGWTVEVAIPLSSLRYSTSRRWNVDVARRIKHLNNERDSWMPMLRGATGVITQYGPVSGFDQLPQRRVLDVIPSVTSVSQTGQQAYASVGVSARAGLSPGVTADLAVNPDFAQVEADEPVITVNQRYPIFYAEKRPFFLEGIELWRSALNTVHTRAIVDPFVAGKLTGKRGGTTFGLLLAADDAPGHFSDAERQDRAMAGAVALYDGRRSEIGIARLRREVGAASNVGLLGTAYHFVDRSNVTLSGDARLAGTNRSASLQLVGTWARRPFYDPDTDSDSLRDGSGLGYYLLMRNTGRHLNYWLTGNGRSPDYVSETGYTPLTNNNTWSADVQWNSEPHGGRALVSWSGAFTSNIWFDWQGRSTYGFLWPRLTLNFRRLTSATIGPYLDYQRLLEEQFGPKRNALQAGAFADSSYRRTVYRGFAVTGTSNPVRTFGFAWSLDWSWDAFDYDFGGGPKYPRASPAALADPNAPLDPGLGDTFDASLSATWRPLATLRVGGGYTRSQLRRNDTFLWAYVENIWSGKLEWQFTRFAFVRLRADYQSSVSALRPQFLLSWSPRPGTAAYLGYNDDLRVNGFDPANGAPEHGVHRNSRTLFLKLSWLIG